MIGLYSPVTADDVVRLVGTKLLSEYDNRERSNLDKLWRIYKDTALQSDRNLIATHYMPVVRKVAQTMAYGLPASVDVEDLNSYGLFGLFDAIEKFDPDLGFKFETYAVQRIRGAIVDSLRALDWVPRSVRSRARILEAALGDDPTRDHDKAAKHLGWTRQETDDTLMNVSSGNVMSLEAKLDLEDDTTNQVTSIAHFLSGANTPEDYVAVQYIISEVAGAIDRLPQRENIIVALYYYEGLTLAEIGALLGVTESRVCQIHTKVCYTVKRELLN